ncbi:MAG: DUF3298 domain-containing protein [candidate division WOR-3 bacterium]|nr:DUF3298 domain-containing protein [candidate division WOR-3 bacterium]
MHFIILISLMLSMPDYTVDSLYAHTNHYDIICEYIDFQCDSLSLVEEHIKKASQNIYDQNMDFLEESGQFAKESGMKYFTEFRIKDILQNKNTVSILGYLESYTGGAHGIHNYETFNYDIISGSTIHLKDIIDYNALERISQYCREGIAEEKSERYEDYEGLKNDDFLLSGTEAKWANFNEFIIKEDSIMFIFDEYTVAPYYMGDFRITVPQSIYR